MVKSFSFSKEKEEGNIVECRPVPLLQQTYPQPKRFCEGGFCEGACVCVRRLTRKNKLFSHILIIIF